MKRKIVVYSIAIMSTLMALIILWQFRSAVIYLLISLGLAAAVNPLVKHWSRHGLVARLALLFLFLFTLGSSIFLLILVGGSVIGEIRQLANTLAVQDEWKLPLWLQGSTLRLPSTVQLPSPSQLFTALTGDQGQLLLPALVGLTRSIFGLVSGLLVVLFLSLYWSMNQVHFERLWLSLLPPAQRNRTRNIWLTIQADLGGYIRSQLAQGLLAGLLLGLGYWALGSPYAALLAVTGALACLIPMVGIGLALILPLVIGLVTSAQLSLFTVLYTLVVLIALEVWARPRLFYSRQYNPILSLIILIALAKVFGLVGMLVAPPLSAAIQILWSHYLPHAVVSGSASQLSDLKERQIRLQAVIHSMGDESLPFVTSSMERLNSLMEKAEPILQDGLPGAVESP